MLDLNAFLANGALISCAEGKVLVGWGKRQLLATPEDFMQPVFYFPDFFLEDEKPWFQYEYVEEIKIQELIKHLHSAQPLQPLLSWKTTQRELFESMFNDLKSYFRDGMLKKGVPFIFETSEGSLSSVNICYLVLNALLYTERHPVFIYGFWDSEEGMLGATPESLFHMQQQGNITELTTVACAGTCPTMQASNLLKDDKLLQEHNLVVEGIFNSLQPFGNVLKGEKQLLQLPGLCHLVTPIKLSGEGDLCFEQLLTALHPTPALGAYPKDAGARWLRMLQQKVDRRRFGAPVGYTFANTQVSIYVAIRNAQWKRGEIAIGMGCGIVEQSQLSVEWNEILLKAESIKNILGL